RRFLPAGDVGDDALRGVRRTRYEHAEHRNHYGATDVRKRHGEGMLSYPRMQETPMAIRPTQPQRADGVLDTAVRLSKASVVKVLPLSLLMMLASTPGSFYVFIAGGGVDMSDPFGMVRLMLSPGYLLVSAASGIVMMLIAAAVSLKMAAIADDGDMSTATALLQALRHVPSLLVSLVLYVIVV